MSAKAETPPFVHVTAPELGYTFRMVDDFGDDVPGSGREPAGLIMTNPDGDAPLYIPERHLAAVAHQLITEHVRVGRLKAEVKR
jgi:hypothetical protein